MPSARRPRRPDLRVIEGGLAQASDVTRPTTPSSPSPESPAPTKPSTDEGTTSSTWSPSPTRTEKSVRVLVCGSRTWDDVVPIYTFLRGLHVEYPNITVAHGGAQGADTMAGEAAAALGLDVRVYPAQWDKHGKAAGFIRNKQMVEEFKPHLVLACSESPITKGTQHTVNLAKKAGLPLYLFGHG